jgi:cell division protein FtsW
MSDYRFSIERIKAARPADPILIITVILLIGIGLVSLFSASTAFAGRFFDDENYFIRKQIVFGLVGLVLLFIASYSDLEFIRKLIKPLIAFSFVLCILTFIPGIGMSKNGAARWIQIAGNSYQPSELVKLALPLYLAHMFSKKEDRLDDASSSVIPPAIITAAFCLLVYLQNDFSSAAFLALNALALFYLACIRIRHFLAIAGIFLPLGMLLVFTKDHRLQRVMSFIFPEYDPLGAGFQVRSSLDALASGGLWGKGLGRGTKKIASVPEIHSDFILTAFGEESGFIGILLCFALFAVFAARGIRTGSRSGDSFKRLLALGLTIMIVSQALLNAAVVVGAVPATGIPLPLFSAGGSSLATSLLMIGLLVNISRDTGTSEVGNVR